MRQLAFLAPSDIAILEAFLGAYRPPLGRVAARSVADSVTAAIAGLAAARGEPANALREAIYRGVRALDDAQRSARVDGARRIQ